MEEEIDRKPGYMAYLPATVRYDSTLRPNAKLLYAEITALAECGGYCYASNRKLGSWFGLDGKTVSDLVSTLAKKKYIRVEVVRNPVTQAVVKRKIWVARHGVELPEPPLKNEDTPPLENKDTPPLENEETPPLKITAYNDIKKLNVNPYSPQGGAVRKCANSELLAQAFELFWAAYPKHRDRKRAEKAFYRLNPDEPLLNTMLAAVKKQSATDGWRRDAGKYIPMPTTWLNGERWTDEVGAAVHGVVTESGLQEWI